MLILQSSISDNSISSLTLSLCLSLLACNASWVELWSKHQDNRKQKAMDKEQSKITSLSTRLDFPNLQTIY